MAYIDFEFSQYFCPDQDPVCSFQSRPPPAYASPEQLREEEHNMFCADVYNLGKVLLKELEDAHKVSAITQGQ